MGKWLPLLAVEVEDRRFYSHPGVDPLALARALWQNLSAGGLVSGASTISSQVIRVTYPRRRTLEGKVREFVQACMLERELDKERILELYLNRAPFGGPLRGVEAAARSYFGKRAEDVSLSEAALLIGMLRGPSLYRPDRNPEKILERRNTILRRLLQRKVLPESTLQMALLEPLPAGRGAMPGEARHFADFVLRSLPAGYWEAGGQALKTTFNPALQRLLELRLREALSVFPEEVTAAGGIVDNARGALLAYVGNARFNLEARSQWVDCGASPRSPGSTLKPFLYLLAYEQGRLIPASLLADTPLSFSGSAPRNYDRSYRGPVTAGSALADSLNAPAVRVLRLAGGESGLQIMRRSGLSGLGHTAEHYGDSLALGGCEITVLQALNAFSSLASLGVRRPLTALAERAGPRLGEERIFSQAGAYLIAESLRDTRRLPILLRKSLADQRRSVAFKTGTSYGFRDAWTAAYTPEHTAVIWIGDPQGRSHLGLSGQPAAAPAAVSLLLDIPCAPGEARWYSPPPELERFAACSLSGMPATPVCPGRAMQWRVKDVSAVTPCSMHLLRAGQVRTLLPPELEFYVARKDTGFSRREQLEITSPQPGIRYFYTPQAPEQQIALTVEGARGTVHWFMDQEFFAAQPGGGSLLLPLKPGKHTLSMLDEEGRFAATTFSVVDIMEQRAPALRLE
jgi:penicillin-binding protein 1C